jgi:hypothetical protein
MKLSDYSKSEKKLLTTNLLTQYFIRCWKHSTKYVINTNISPRYYNLIKLCFVRAKDQICWSNVLTMLIDCSITKKKHFKKTHSSSFHGHKKKWKFLRRCQTKHPKHFSPSSNKCFICKRKCHFAKTCPQKKAQPLRLIDFLAQNTKFNLMMMKLNPYSPSLMRSLLMP